MDINQLFKKPLTKHGLEKVSLPRPKKPRLSQDVPQEPTFIEGEEEDERFLASGMSAEQQEIWDLVDTAETTPATIDSQTLKRMVLKFEKALTRNQELRIKYSSDPTKFIESEADLDIEIKNLNGISSVPELYPLVIDLGTLDSLLTLLSHENTDIVIAATSLLNEWTDEDVVVQGTERDLEGMTRLVKALIEKQFLHILIQNLARLDESQAEDQQGVFYTLSVIENMSSFEPEILDWIVSHTVFLSWLLERIQAVDFDSVKQYTSELLAILVQNSQANRTKMNELRGMDILLSVLSRYRKKDPTDEDEIELLENLFDALCAMLSETSCKSNFLACEGIELMVLMIKEKKLARIRAVKVLDHAFLTVHGKPLAHHFIDMYGLKTLFSLYMKKGIKSYKKEYKSFSEMEEEEHILSILHSLFQHADDLEMQVRLLAKFLDLEKVDRLLELHFEYSEKVSKWTHLDYFEQLEKGLFTLQLVDVVLLHCIAFESPQDSIKQHVLMLLERKKESMDSIRRIVQGLFFFFWVFNSCVGYADNLGQEEELQEKESKDQEKSKIYEWMTLHL